jgi:hypothetical protein
MATFEERPEEAYAAYCEAGKRLHGLFFNGGHRDN